jgi:serine/threonine protein kinase
LVIRDQVPQIENPKRLSLPAAAEAILKQMFATHQRVVIRAELGSGFSGSRVFVVHPIIEGTPELPAVIKMAPVGLIEDEYRAYQKHIRNKLAGAAEIRGEPVLCPGSDWGGLLYDVVGSGIFEIESLYSFCRRASNKDIWHVLEKRLFRRMGEFWRHSSANPLFDLRSSYDHLLPVNLLIEPTTLPPPNAPLHLLRLDSIGQSLQRGDYVRLEGFAITEVDRDNQAVTLNLPAPTDGPPVSYRLRLQPVETTSPFQVNDILDSIEGVVTATRYDLLQTYAQRALDQNLAETLTLLSKANVTLPNPLAVLPSILSEARDVRVAYIHGDLNLENILVDPEARDVRLIDFAMARRDHVLHDLLRVETGVVTWLLPEALAEAELPSETIHGLYEQLHCAARLFGHSSAPHHLHPTLRKSFVLLTAIRKTARKYLLEPDDWGEYYQGLTLYLLGALKFKNLDDMPQAPLPKQVAFWGAAAIQKLLQEQPRCEEIAWKPLTTLIGDLTGQALERYEIGKLLGEGSTATVYRARQPGLERDVAVKVMLPRLAADPIFHQRFEREAQAIAHLRHPNILTVYDYGETDDERLYLVVDYVGGGTLRERLEKGDTFPPFKGGTMPLEEAVEIVAQMAEALDYAHSQGVIHRDVKPSNILLTLDGHPLLADFGLAKPRKSDRRLTGSDMMLGTPDYMAPEQAQGLEVDGRADIYALGVTLFEMLTGQHPYEGESPLSVVLRHINEPMPRPSEINSAVPPALDEVVARATAKSPDERYQRAGEMARALRAGERGLQQRKLAALDAKKVAATVKRWLRAPTAKVVTIGGAILLVTVIAVAWPIARALEKGETPTPTLTITTVAIATETEQIVPLTPTLYPTYTSYPTYTPLPTDTPVPPTPTPLPSTDTPTLTQTPVPPTATATHTPRPPTPTPVPTAVPQPLGSIALTIYLRDTRTETGFAALSGDQPNGGMIYEEGKFVYGDAAVQIGDAVYHFDKPEVEPGEPEQLPDLWQVEFEFAEALVARTGNQVGFDPKKAQFWVGTLDGSSAVGEDNPYSLTMKLYEGNELRESIQVFFTVADAPEGGGASGGPGKPEPD